nr:MAG TPA: hypothetical protein [Bacteriophage sp.]
MYSCGVQIARQEFQKIKFSHTVIKPRTEGH